MQSFISNLTIKDRQYNNTNLNNALRKKYLSGDTSELIHLRADSNKISTYPIALGDDAGWLYGTNAEILRNGRILRVMLVDYNNEDINHGEYHAMCHLQKFQILITNPLNNPIVSNVGSKRLDNFRYFPGDFQASTIPPGMGITTVAAKNIGIFNEPRYPYWWPYGQTYGHLRPIIHSFNVMDQAGEKINIVDVNGSAVVDQENRTKFNVDVYRLTPSGFDLPKDGSYEFNYNTNFMYAGSLLFSKQRMVQVYDWTHSYDADYQCEMTLSKLLSDFSEDATNSTLGKLLLQLFGNTETTVDETSLMRIISSAMTSLVNDNNCNSADNHHKGAINFWLSNESTIFSTHNTAKNMNGDDQDWALWGVGEHGMYKIKSRESYFIGSSTLYIPYAFHNTNKIIIYNIPLFGMEIETISTGDSQ
jgi:hypothetical protein